MSGAQCQAGAVDVVREGAPFEGDHLMPVDRDEAGIPMASPPGDSRPQDAPEVQQGPRAVEPVPPGLHPLSHAVPQPPDGAPVIRRLPENLDHGRGTSY